MEIHCSRCLLRPLVATDADSLAFHANDAEVARNLRDRFPHPYDRSDAAAYIANVATRPVQTSFGIVVGDEAIGTISLVVGDDIASRSAEVGYWIGQSYWGQGIAATALHATTRYAFETLGLARVFAAPFVSTVRSVRVLEKVGYVCEGLLRRSAFKHGILLDQWMFAAYDDRQLIPPVS